MVLADILLLYYLKSIDDVESAAAGVLLRHIAMRKTMAAVDLTGGRYIGINDLFQLI